MLKRPPIERYDINPMRNGRPERSPISQRITDVSMHVAELALRFADFVSDIKNEINELREPGHLRAATGMDFGTYHTPKTDRDI